MDEPGVGYDEDFLIWSRQQATALRAAGRCGANLPLDWENIAEEIESLGRSDKRELFSQVHRIVVHLLKLTHSPAGRPRAGWRVSINDARNRVDRLLYDSPSLRNEIEHALEAERPRAARSAIDELGECGELDQLVIARIQQQTYTPDQVVGDWFPPDPDRR